MGQTSNVLIARVMAKGPGLFVYKLVTLIPPIMDPSGFLLHKLALGVQKPIDHIYRA
jgi:hypothetical protein